MTGGEAVKGYSLVSATLDDALVEDLASSALPSDWNMSPVPPRVQAVGDAWVQSGRSLALRVPSVLVTGGFNILMNVEHPGFATITVDSIERFAFDPRLLR
jgi:RES domain-containing protein